MIKINNNVQNKHFVLHINSIIYVVTQQYKFEKCKYNPPFTFLYNAIMS